jgi:rubrerythrin
MVAEKHHEERYKKLHDLVKDDLFFKRDEEIYWTCTKCGYVWKGKEPPKVCPLCGHEQGYYIKMNEDF